MRLPNLDRCGAILRNTPKAGVGGAVVDSMEVVLSQYWVAKVTMSSRTIVSGARDAADTELVFIGRWFPGLDDGQCWFDLEGRRYRVTRAEELGRREGWQFYGKAIT